VYMALFLLPLWADYHSAMKITKFNSAIKLMNKIHPSAQVVAKCTSILECTKVYSI
jgi:hypothetical protein